MRHLILTCQRTGRNPLSSQRLGQIGKGRRKRQIVKRMESESIYPLFWVRILSAIRGLSAVASAWQMAIWQQKWHRDNDGQSDELPLPPKSTSR